jgi:23S rRNA (pseudouridine1915-N3)-methyltransferase
MGDPPSPVLFAMKFRVVVVGKVRQSALADAIADFEQRAARYWPLEVIEVRDESGRGETDVVRRREGERLLEHAKGAAIVACDEHGASFDSARFADWMQRHRESARDVTFAVGGAYGLDAAVLDASTERLALAPWTLPHEVARLVLAEQLYRAGTIVRREPYHK